MLILSSSKLTIGLAVSCFYALALLATSIEARTVREEDAQAIKQHVDSENRVLFKRQAGGDMKTASHGKRKRPHGSKKSSTTTVSPDESATTGAPDDSTTPSPTTKRPGGKRKPSKKPKRKSSTTTRRPKAKTTRKQRTKKPTTTTPEPSDDGSDPDSSTKKPSKVGVRRLKPRGEKKSKADSKERKKLNPAYEAIVTNQEYTAFEHMMAGVDNWMKVLKLSGGKVFNRVLAGELLDKLNNGVKSKLRKEDKVDKLIEAFKQDKTR